MARITPTVTSTVQNSVYGDKRTIVANISITGTYASASAAAGGVKVAPSLVGLTAIDTIEVIPKFTADAVAHKVTWVGAATGTDAPAHVLALLDKDDDLETADATSVSAITATIRVTGR